MNDTNELPVIDCEDCFLLVGDTDSRWSVLEGLVDPSRHCEQDYNRLKGSQRYLSVSVKTLSCWLKINPISTAGVLSKMSAKGMLQQ